MELLRWINLLLTVVFFLCYAYQFVYLVIPFCKKAKHKAPAKPHRFAVLICGRNEETVIASLIESLKKQRYPQEMLSVFVMADNCTDQTAKIARQAGAIVYERFDTDKIGKGYALDTLLSHIGEDYPEGFDGYFVFDADNLLEEDYIEQMNRVFSDGYDIVTSYRNSKNFGDNWISAGYALWFVRESRYLNHARMLLGTSCSVSGTGFLFSRKVLEEQGGWPFHLLTEDMEFSAHHILEGYRIGFAEDAVFYDEQPTSFRQSCRQRLRWAKGYLQVFGKYGTKLLKGALRGNFSCFDMSMSIMPAILVTLLGAVCNAVMTLVGLSLGGTLWEAVWSMLEGLFVMYLTLFALGAITVVTERKRIYMSAPKKLLYCFTFPLFMFTYIPVSLAALFSRKVTWKPIAHRGTASSVPQSKTPAPAQSVCRSKDGCEI